VGNNKTWLEIADKVILGQYQPSAKMEGMHDIYMAPPFRHAACPST
jgi:acyl-CoA hydrolase